MSMMIHRNKRKKVLREKQEMQMIENVPYKYTEAELQEMTSKEIKTIAAEKGYELPPSPPASREDVIAAFIEQQ